MTDSKYMKSYYHRPEVHTKWRKRAKSRYNEGKQDKQFMLKKNEHSRVWYFANREKCREKANRKRAEAKAAAFDKLGNLCANPSCRHLNEDGTLGCKDPRALQIDHILGGGNKERKELKDCREIYRKVLADNSGKYQLLCATCNWIKRS